MPVIGSPTSRFQHLIHADAHSPHRAELHDPRANDLNAAMAEFNYGMRLLNGDGVSLDLAEAAKYFKLAADQNVARAQFQYTVCLQKGCGAPVDLIGAARYFKLAADQFDHGWYPTAMINEASRRYCF
jgi:TPR repeat protein